MQIKFQKEKLLNNDNAKDRAARFSSVATDDSLQVVALIPRGEVIRNFVYTSCLNQVAEQAKLSLLTISPNAEMNRMLRAQFENVRELENLNEQWLVRFEREILDMAHGRWLWSNAARERWRRRDSEATTLRQQSVRTVKKIASYPFASRAGLRTLSKIERASSRWLRTTDLYLDLFKQLKPSLVFNGSHIHSRVATQAVQAAQWLGIPTTTFIFSWDNLTSQGRIMLPYDYFLVWNETLRKQLLEMYEWIRPEQVFVTGTPQFDFHFRTEFHWSREEFCSFAGADATRPIILYTTGMANQMPNEPEIVEDIANILNEFDCSCRPQLLVRIYPKDLTGRFEELKNRRKDILFPPVAWEAAWLTPKYEDSYALVNALRHAALGINVASTISLELCMFDKPVINVGYNPQSVSQETVSYADYYEFDHYKPIVESGAVRVARNREQMKDFIFQGLATPSEFTRERQALIEKMFGSTLDGKSGSRVANKLLELARR